MESANQGGDPFLGLRLLLQTTSSNSHHWPSRNHKDPCLRLAQVLTVFLQAVLKVFTSNTLLRRRESGKSSYLLVFIFWSEICFSSCLLSFTSAPYFPVVPLSARMKWECMLLRTVSLLIGLDMVWYGRTTCRISKERGRSQRKESSILKGEMGRENREREGKPIHWDSESTVYFLFLILVGIEARFVVNVLCEARLCWKNYVFIYLPIAYRTRVYAFVVHKNWHVKDCFILRLIFYLLRN